MPERVPYETSTLLLMWLLLLLLLLLVAHSVHVGRWLKVILEKVKTGRVDIVLVLELQWLGLYEVVVLGPVNI